MFDLPINEDMFYLVSHIPYPLTGCLSLPAFLILHHQFFTRVSLSSTGLHWKSQNQMRDLTTISTTERGNYILEDAAFVFLLT